MHMRDWMILNLHSLSINGGTPFLRPLVIGKPPSNQRAALDAFPGDNLSSTGAFPGRACCLLLRGHHQLFHRREPQKIQCPSWHRVRMSEMSSPTVGFPISLKNSQHRTENIKIYNYDLLKTHSSRQFCPGLRCHPQPLGLQPFPRCS